MGYQNFLSYQKTNHIKFRLFRASNNYESKSDELAVLVEDPKGEPVEICEDNPTLANCEMIVRANWCFVGMFQEICCKSCKEAGAKPPPTTTSQPPTTEVSETVEAADETVVEVPTTGESETVEATDEPAVEVPTTEESDTIEATDDTAVEDADNADPVEEIATTSTTDTTEAPIEGDQEVGDANEAIEESVE